MSTCRDQVLTVAAHLAARSPDGTFTAAEVAEMMARDGSRYTSSTIRTHVTSRMCADAPDHHARVYDDLERAGEHRYRLRHRDMARSEPIPAIGLPDQTTASVLPAVVEEPLPEVPAGNSSVQRQAESVALRQLSQRMGVQFVSERLHLAGGTYVDVDGVSHEPPVLVEVSAHQGSPKGGQRHKVLADAFKLSYAAEVLGGSYRRMLCFTDEEAAQPFRGRSWYAAALRHQRIEIEVVALPHEWRHRIREAQLRQSR